MSSPLRSSLFITGVMALLTGWACTTGPASSGPPPQLADELDRATTALEAGDYAEAVARLREAAGRCEAGARGRRALLLLATTALDPRNPEASADTGARLATHFLGLPGIRPHERAMAETLYLIASAYGAEVGEADRTDADSATVAAVGGLAARFEDCGADVPTDTVGAGSLPALPDSAYLLRFRAERDALAARVAALEAELERIRSLLQQGVLPDTGGVRP